MTFTGWCKDYFLGVPLDEYYARQQACAPMALQGETLAARIRSLKLDEFFTRALFVSVPNVVSASALLFGAGKTYFGEGADAAPYVIAGIAGAELIRFFGVPSRPREDPYRSKEPRPEDTIDAC